MSVDTRLNITFFVSGLALGMSIVNILYKIFK